MSFAGLSQTDYNVGENQSMYGYPEDNEWLEDATIHGGRFRLSVAPHSPTLEELNGTAVGVPQTSSLKDQEKPNGTAARVPQTPSFRDQTVDNPPERSELSEEDNVPATPPASKPQEKRTIPQGKTVKSLKPANILPKSSRLPADVRHLLASEQSEMSEEEIETGTVAEKPPARPKIATKSPRKPSETPTPKVAEAEPTPAPQKSATNSKKRPAGEENSVPAPKRRAPAKPKNTSPIATEARGIAHGILGPHVNEFDSAMKILVSVQKSKKPLILQACRMDMSKQKDIALIYSLASQYSSTEWGKMVLGVLKSSAQHFEKSATAEEKSGFVKSYQDTIFQRILDGDNFPEYSFAINAAVGQISGEGKKLLGSIKLYEISLDEISDDYIQQQEEFLESFMSWYDNKLKN